jgi:hypothetical protein
MDGLVANESLQKVEIGFEDIQITLKQKKQKEDRLILDGSIRGKALPGRMVRFHKITIHACVHV